MWVGILENKNVGYKSICMPGKVNNGFLNDIKNDRFQVLCVLTSLLKCPQTQVQTQIRKLNFTPPEKLQTVKLGQYQLKSMSEWYQGFISANTICS